MGAYGMYFPARSLVDECITDLVMASAETASDWVIGEKSKSPQPGFKLCDLAVSKAVS